MNLVIRIWRATWLVAILVCGSGTSCNTVEFYEKGKLQSPVMDMARNRCLSHFEQKVFYSIEGVAGGIGAAAGGGCGCY